MISFFMRAVVLCLCVAVSACVTVGGMHLGPQRISVHPPAGPSGPMATLLAQSVVQALVDRGYAANVSLDRSADFILQGRAETLPVNRAPMVAALHWVLINKQGQEVAFLTQAVQGSAEAWAYGSPEILALVGEESAANISPFIGAAPQAEKEVEEDEVVVPQVVAALPAPPAPPPLPIAVTTTKKRPFGIWVDFVTGAPGDGNQALTGSIRRSLREAALPFAMSASSASHYVQGVVDISARDAGSEHVAIVWVVSDTSGKEIGRITQRNDIARGALHQAWGEVADYAAQGGVDGVLAILERELGQVPRTTTQN